jgi:hypothetical protein
VKKQDRSGDEGDRERESRRERRRRQREAVKRQKALVASERARRKEREKATAEAEKKAEPEADKTATPKTAKKPTAEKKPAAKKKPAEKKPAVAKKPKAKRPSDRDSRKDPKEQPDPKGKPQRKRRRRGFAGAKRVGAGARKTGAGISAVGVELLKLGREMLVIPLQLWLGLAEIIGRFVLAAWLRAVLPALRLLRRVAVALLHFGERHITPARALAVVALVALGALVAAQWRDYSEVSVGVDAYSGDVGAVAPPPEVSSAQTHDAHGWVMLIIAALGVVAVLGAVLKRRRLAIWLVPLGIAVIAIAVAVDAPKGLDEGSAALAYESASASLLSGFWLQIAAGSVLIACGLMLPRALQPTRSSARAATGPSLFDQGRARVQRAIERRRARPRTERKRRRLPKLRRPAAKGKVQGAGT